ncbi:hypothetical protein A2U01_0085496, partial [Trifolium medium]|nr:hypothetical protein [Trifolium medium]
AATVMVSVGISSCGDGGERGGERLRIWRWFR